MDDPKKDQNEGITAISVQGFKSVAAESRIEVCPLTILAGANSSGKSSIMQPLLLMKQTLEANYDPGPLLLNGPNAKFMSANQFISRLQENSASQSFSIGIEHAKGRTLKVVFSLSKNQTLEIQKMVIGEGKRSLCLTPNPKDADLENPILTSRLKEVRWPKQLKPSLSVVKNRCFLDVNFEGRQVIGVYYEVSKTGGFSEPYSENLHSMIHIPGLRGNPERVYPRTATGPHFPGIFENYVATIIEQWQQKEDDRLQDLEAILSVLGLTREISVKGVNNTQIELQVGRLLEAEPNGADLVNIADVGFGISQVLPVLVALLVAESGQLVYLEQPELHLHPRAQYELARILADTAKRGVRLVVETHSSLLLLMIQTLMAKGDLESDLVRLHWFSRSLEDGTTAIQSADLDENGAFGDWPEDFGDVELKAEGAYLDAVEGRSQK